MSTDTPVQKDEPNASAEQQSAPVQPVSEEPVAPVTETAATDTDAQPSPAPETETVTPPPAEPAPAKPSPVQEEKAAPAPKAAKVSRSPAPEAQPQTSSFASRCFNGLASVGPLVLILFWLIQSMPTFMGRELHALHNLGVGLFGVAASGLPSPELYPVYHWFLSALSLIPGIDSLSLAAYIPGVQPTAGLEQISGYPVQLLPIASALSVLFLILLTWALARATGNDRRTAFASGLVLLTGFACMGLPRISGSDMLFTAILTLAGICLYRGWIKAFAPLWLFAGFALVALSALAGGLLGLVLPLLVSLVFLLWRGTFRRAGARDGALAFGLLLVLLLAWGTFIAFGDGGRELLKTLLENEYLAPVLEAWKLQGQDSWIIVALLAVLWLPWTLLLLFLPWGRIGTFFKGIVVNRKQRPGQGWLWCSAIVTLAVLALLGANMPVLLMPLLPPLAVLTAQGVLNLSARGSRGFFLLLAILLIALGLLFAAANVYPLFLGELPAPLSALQPTPLALVAALVQTCGLLLLGIILWKVLNRSFAGGALLVLTFLVLVYTAPMAYYAAAGAPVAVATPVEPAPAQEDPATEKVPSETPVQPSGPDAPVTDEQAAPAPSTPVEAPAATDRKPRRCPPLKNRLPQRKRLLRPSPLPRTDPSPKSIAPDRTDPGRFFYGVCRPVSSKKVLLGSAPPLLF